MNMIQIHIMMIALFTSIACVLPGCFLMLRGAALMSDAISHAILPGIVLTFLWVQQLESFWLMIGASMTGMLTVVCTEYLVQQRLLKKDAAIGFVFPLFFSVGVILISLYTRNVHLDLDMVLLGELVFAPFNRLILYGYDLGPYGLWTSATIAGIAILFISSCYQALHISSFDPTHAAMIGIRPRLTHYGLMALTSLVTVGAFNVVGSIVVIALTLTPPATAYLLTKRLSTMLWISVACGIISAIGGYALAWLCDLSISGSIATVSGLLFAGALIGAPGKGLLAHALFQRKRQRELARQVLQAYQSAYACPPSVELVAHDLNWSVAKVRKISRLL